MVRTVIRGISVRLRDALIPLLFFAVACLLAPRSLHAAPQRGDTAVLPVVTVTATRVDSAPAPATASTTVLQGESLRRRGISSIGEALRLVPGAAVVQSGSPGSETAVFMRGGEREFLLVLVDGVQLNEPGGFINLANISLDNVERVEVVRGPVSVLYGSDAVSGVVQIFTRKSELGRRGEISAAGGSADTRNGEISLRAVGETGSYSLGAARYSTQGIYDLNNRSRRESYSAAASLDISARTRAGLTARLTDGQYNYPTSFYGAPLDSNSFNYERRLSSGLDLSHKMSDALDAKLDLGYTRQSTILADPPDGGTPFPFESRGKTERRLAGARLNYRPWSATVLTGGVEYEAQNSATEGGDTPAQNPLLERWTKSAYAQLLSRTVREIDVSLGARVDDNQRYGVFFTWRASAGIPVNNTTRLSGSMGSGFREPQFIELSGGGFARPNPSLQPERTLSGEVGIERSFFDSRAVFAATWFHQTFNDLIRFATLTNDPDWFNEYQNFERAIATGWELELRTQIVSNIHLTSGFTLLSTRLEIDGPENGTPLLRRPSRYGSAGVQWEASESLSLDGVVTYVGRRTDTRFFADFSSQRERLGGYGKLDLSARYAISSSALSEHPVELTARVDNALDRRYEAVAGFETPGRRYTFGVRLVLAY